MDSAVNAGSFLFFLKGGLMYIRDLETEKKSAIKAAKELCYGEGCIKKLKEAKTSNEINRILRTARKEKK